MIELMEIIVILAAMALLALAIAAWFLCVTAIRLEGHVERLVLVREMKQQHAPERAREKPPDAKTPADYEAPLVRRARERMEARMRREHGGA